MIEDWILWEGRWATDTAGAAAGSQQIARKAWRMGSLGIGLVAKVYCPGKRLSFQMKHFFASLTTSGFSALVRAQAPADLVLVNGKIWTVDDKRPEVEAVAVLGNRIAAVGSTQEIRKSIGANTKMIDLQDKRVTPDFNDSRRARLFLLFCFP